MKEKRIHIGFTLAEVLVTLGIIGVVAAMTIPNLMTNIRYMTIRNQFKKSYSEWNQAAMLFMEDHDMSIPAYAAENGINAFVAELPKYIKGFSKYSDWSYAASLTGTKMPYKIKSLNGSYATSFLCDSTGFYSNLAGSTFSYDAPPRAGYNGPRMCIDINGPKAPNTLGIDIFSFQFTTDGHVIPEGADHKDNNYITSIYVGGTKKAAAEYCSGSSDSSALACAYYAFNNISPKGNGTYWENFVIKKK